MKIFALTMSRNIFCGILVSFILTGSACQKKEEEFKPSAKPVAQEALTPAATGESSIFGQVLFEGTVPQPAKTPISAFPECKYHHPGGVSVAKIQAKNGKLKDVFVYVKEGLPPGTYPVPQEPVILDQKGCLFSPHVIGIQIGQPLLIVNSDPMLHNAHAVLDGRTLFNLSFPVQGMKVIRRLSTPGIVKFKCDIHGWMAAYVGVLNHPYFSVTGEDGTFEIRNLPAERYTIEAWHEEFSLSVTDCVVGPKAREEMTFRFRK